MNIIHANTDVHSRRLNTELPGDEVKYISKLQSHFLTRDYMIGFFNRSHLKESNYQCNISIDLKMHRIYEFQGKQVH